MDQNDMLRYAVLITDVFFTIIRGGGGSWGFLVSRVLGFLVFFWGGGCVSEFLGLLVCWFQSFVVSWFQSFLVSRFQSFLNAWLQRANSIYNVFGKILAPACHVFISCLLEDIDPIFKIVKKL